MRLTGLGVSPGIGIGKALVIKRGTRDLRFRVPAALVGRELERLEAARERSREQIQQIKERIAATVGIEHALTKNQTLRIEYRGSDYKAENQGVGDFTMPERAVTRSSNEHQLRFQVQGLIGKTTLHELRVQYRRQNNEATSVSDAVSINVLDAFNKGGAGVNNRG